MKKWKLILVFLACLSLLCSFSACTAKPETSEYTESCYGGDREALANYGNFIAEITLGFGDEDQPPHFLLQNAEGQTTTLEGRTATGNIKLFSATEFGSTSNYAVRYIMPSSERYIITPAEGHDALLCLISDRILLNDISQKTDCFTFSARDIKLIDYSITKSAFLGCNMEYILCIDAKNINPDTAAMMSFNFFGEGESRLTIKYDGNTLLFKGDQAESRVELYGRDANENDVDALVGVCPAGRWSRLSYNGTEWILTEEPPSPWPWVALGVGVLLAAAASFLLYRRRKVTLPAFSEDPEHDATEHPPEEL